ADMYLASSRGAFVAAGVAMIAYFVLAPRRWEAGAAIALAGAAGVAAIATLVHRTALVNGKTSTALGIAQGRHAGFLLALVCLGSAIVWLGFTELGMRLPPPPRVVGQAIVVAVVALAVVALVASHPVAKFDEF